MSKPIWYGDESAKHFHTLFVEALGPLLRYVAPDYELSHLGIQRMNEVRPDSEEVRIVLHLNKIGKVKCGAVADKLLPETRMLS